MTEKISIGGINNALFEQPGNDIDLFAAADVKNSSVNDTEPDAPIPVPNTKERIKIIKKITAYKNAFPQVCEEVDPSQCHYMDDQALNEYLIEVETSVSSRNSGLFIKKKIDKGIMAVDMVGSQFYPPISGFYGDVCNDPDYQEILTELSIKYDSYEAYPPEIRLMFVIAQAASCRIMTNNAKANLPQVDAAQIQKYADL